MPILKLENISKSFGAINALNEVSLSINPGEVLGLMGDNGAGKSTLIKIIAGNFKPTSGNIIFNEEKVEFAKPMDARNKGIEVVYQDLALCDNLSAASNIFLTREIKKNFSIFSIIDFKKMYEKSREIFKELKSVPIKKILPFTCPADTNLLDPSSWINCRDLISPSTL